MREKVIKGKLMNKNKRHCDLKMSSVKTRTAHSRDRYAQVVNDEN
jgi:hypothetical protein